MCYFQVWLTETLSSFVIRVFCYGSRPFNSYSVSLENCGGEAYTHLYCHICCSWPCETHIVTMSISQLLKSRVHSDPARNEASSGLQSFSLRGWELVSSQPAPPASISSRWLELLFQSSVVQCLFLQTQSQQTLKTLLWNTTLKASVSC